MRLKNRLFWIAAFVAFVVDQLTKLWVVKTFELGETLPLLPGIFHFTYLTNTGAAFSILSGKVEWLRWLSLGVSLVLIAIASWGPVLSFWEQLGYGLILGGAMGNGIDRFALGYVVDFLDFRLINFAVFNLADSCISIGIVCLLIASFQKTPNSHHRIR
ncbi:signal peptidase II [Sphaerospermopsis torques-reginae]|uniref:Lipoprotein signal peptidase n=1 Tax=Sphaerospermopsis torques-reginae ITEP-024 TaxID=984208 RepID=A0ABX8X2Z4_9CYAN|nr:signal peptidase II [Sphaerospermopsis torques-reginae]QYX33020.1 signal peptidase II [Sphaerospermopsis torques-reginae ITEP-024]